MPSGKNFHFATVLFVFNYIHIYIVDVMKKKLINNLAGDSRLKKD